MMTSTVFIYLDHRTDDHSCTLAYTKVKTRQYIPQVLCPLFATTFRRDSRQVAYISVSG
jgi:hypothetical protein